MAGRKRNESKKRDEEKTEPQRIETAPVAENSEELRQLINQALRLKSEIKREQDDFNEYQQQRVLFPLFVRTFSFIYLGPVKLFLDRREKKFGG